MPSRVATIPLDSITINADLFQFRRYHGKRGSSGRLKGARRFNHDLAGVLAVWLNPDDGLTYLCDGHNRAALARKCHIREVDVKYVSASSVAEARSAGALLNLSEGHGDELDFARALRESGYSSEQLTAMGLSPAPQIVQDAQALARLDPVLFDEVARDRLPVAAGVIIGTVECHQRQRELARLRGQLGWNDAILAEAAVLAAESELVVSTGPQLSMLQELELGDLHTRLAVRAAVRARLRSQARALQTVTQRTSARWLRSAGCTLNVEQAREQRADAERMLLIFNRRANAGGPLTDYLGELAAEVSRGVEPAKAVESGWSLIGDTLLAEALVMGRGAA